MGLGLYNQSLWVVGGGQEQIRSKERLVLGMNALEGHCLGVPSFMEI